MIHEERQATATVGEWARSSIVFERMAEAPAEGASGKPSNKDATRYGSRAALRRIAQLCERMACRKPKSTTVREREEQVLGSWAER